MLELFAKKKSNKVLDSSVFIDGRILSVLKTGFIEGDFIIPLFVLEEMQRLADSKDHDKRQKGRDGLEMAKKVQALTGAEIWNKKLLEVDEATSTDIKLVLLSRTLNAKILSLDHNLNEISKIHGVTVLNIQELYLAIRPKFLKGDEIFVKIKEKGKEPGQGRGDIEGTMIVVDGGEEFMGQRIKVVVREVYAQETGTLVFAKIIRSHTNANIQST